MATKAIARRTRRVYVRAPRARRSRRIQLPLAVIAGFMPLGFGMVGAFQHMAKGEIVSAQREAVSWATGYNLEHRKWYFSTFLRTYAPLFGGMLIHRMANRLGVNRALAGAGLPFIRV